MRIENRQSRLAGALGLLVKQYGRKARKQLDPNDRRYDHDAERMMTRLSAADLSDLPADDDATEDERGIGSRSP